MVDRFDGVPYSFGALRKTFGPLYLRCDVCRRYAHLYLAELRDAIGPSGTRAPSTV